MSKVGQTKQKTSYGLTNEARQLIEALAGALGISQSSVVEIAVRKLAKAEDVKLPADDRKDGQADAQR